MKDQLSPSFTQWAHQRFLRSSNVNGGPSAVATTWIWSFGTVAVEVQNYLEAGHLGADTLPASLMHESLELGRSSYARFPMGDARRALIDTWVGLAHVYGAAGNSVNRELDRLEMLTDWAEAIEALRYSGFPGLHLMAAGYQAERRRLDLGKLRHDLHDFKYVGALLDLLKRYEPRTKRTRTTMATKQCRVANRKPTVCRPDAVGDSRHVPVVQRTMETLSIEPYGNWRDDWRNTLPEMN